MINKLFAVVDSDGKYVDEHSIWCDEKTKQWYYTSYSGYKFNIRDRNSGVWLYNSEEKANVIIQYLLENLHKVNLKIDFTIQEIY